jgi:hypothetical protein
LGLAALSVLLGLVLVVGEVVVREATVQNRPISQPIPLPNLYEAICLKAYPKNFHLTSVCWPKEEPSTTASDMITLGSISIQLPSWSGTLFFQDQYGQDPFRVNLRIHKGALDLRLEREPSKPVSMHKYDVPVINIGYNDVGNQTTLKLPSGKIVTACCRPQQIGQVVGCGQYISVSGGR